jgi:MFS family permease
LVSQIDMSAQRAARGWFRRRNGLVLSPNVTALGWVSLLMGMSSAMIHALLPVFLVNVLGASPLFIGFTEGAAEGTASFLKVVSGGFSDWLGRRKPLVVLGYGLSALIKPLFAMAGLPGDILFARVIDRVGKGVRDSPRDALLADVTPREIRGSGFGLRGTLYTLGAVTGPLAALAIMLISDGDYRLVFWLAVIPAAASVAVLVLTVRDSGHGHRGKRHIIRRADFADLGTAFWWTVAIAGLLSLARFSHAFLIVKGHSIGVQPALLPLIFVLMNLFYAMTAYPFGALSDHTRRPLQLAVGIALLVGSDFALAMADTVWVLGLGAALWGLHMGVVQGLLSAMIANAVPKTLHGTAFGIYDLVFGVATFLASVGAGIIWTVAGPTMTFGTGAFFALLAVALLLISTMSSKPAKSMTAR